MTDPTIASWSRESDLLFQLRQLREENERLRTALAQPPLPVQPVQEPVGWVAEVELSAAKRSNKESFMVELWKKRLYASDIALYGIKETT